MVRISVTGFAGLDGDGPAMLDERQRAEQRRAALRVAKRFEMLDGNGDGALERHEFDASAAQRFRRLDGDGDGAVTGEEIRRRLLGQGG